MVLERRKPLRFPRLPGALPSRNAERQLLEALLQLPPRKIRLSPDAGPLGSTSGDEVFPAGYASRYQSHTHSHTFPLMSLNCQAFSSFPAAACDILPEPVSELYQFHDI